MCPAEDDSDDLNGPEAPTIPSYIADRKRLALLGYTILNVGNDASLLPASDWHEESFVAVRGKDAQIADLTGKEDRPGAWTALYNRLRAMGYTVTVVDPLEDFQAVLKKMRFAGPITPKHHPLGKVTVWRSPPPHPIRLVTKGK